MADGTTLNVMASGDKIRDIDRGANGKTQVVQLDHGGAGAESLTGASNPLPVAKGPQTVTDCTITSGGSLSAGIDLGVYRLVGIALPSTFEPTQVTFQASYDNSTWNNVYDTTGAEKSVAVGTSRRVILNPSDFYGVRYIKVRGGTSGSPTTVAADRIIKLIAEA